MGITSTKAIYVQPRQIHEHPTEPQRLYQSDSIAVELKQPLYAFDSTTIDLCLSLFPWAEFRKTKAAVKMHTLIARQKRIAQTASAHSSYGHQFIVSFGSVGPVRTCAQT